MNKDVYKGSLTEEEVANLIDRLTRHYGEPVMPVSRYCKAFTDWHQALIDKFKRIDAEEERDSYTEEYPDPLRKFAELSPIGIWKSNLLYRLIYEGQKLRTKPCPKHKVSGAAMVGLTMSVNVKAGQILPGGFQKTSHFRASHL